MKKISKFALFLIIAFTCLLVLTSCDDPDPNVPDISGDFSDFE